MSEPSTAVMAARRAHPPAAPAANGGAQLESALQIANALSKAGKLIPPAFREEPGACLAMVLWGQANDVDPFTAMLNHHMIPGPDGEDRPTPSAEIRVELATRKGFDMRVTESSRERCTIEVWDMRDGRPGSHVGTWTSAIADIPEWKFNRLPPGDLNGELRVKTNRNGSKYTARPGAWDDQTADMLLRDAERKADKRYVRTAATLVDVYAHGHEGDAEAYDAIEVAEAAPALTPAASDDVEKGEYAQVPAPAETANTGGAAATVFYHEPAGPAPGLADVAAEMNALAGDDDGGESLTDPPPPKVTRAEIDALRREAKTSWSNMFQAVNDGHPEADHYKSIDQLEEDQAAMRWARDWLQDLKSQRAAEADG